jgi:hypothetical protein
VLFESPYEPVGREPEAEQDHAQPGEPTNHRPPSLDSTVAVASC